jgi:hypothetical protein
MIYQEHKPTVKLDRLSTPPTPNPLADRNRQMRILITMALVTGHEMPH